MEPRLPLRYAPVRQGERRTVTLLTGQSARLAGLPPKDARKESWEVSLSCTAEDDGFSCVAEPPMAESDASPAWRGRFSVDAQGNVHSVAGTGEPGAAEVVETLASHIVPLPTQPIGIGATWILPADEPSRAVREYRLLARSTAGWVVHMRQVGVGSETQPAEMQFARVGRAGFLPLDSSRVSLAKTGPRTDEIWTALAVAEVAAHPLRVRVNLSATGVRARAPSPFVYADLLQSADSGHLEYAGRFEAGFSESASVCARFPAKCPEVQTLVEWLSGWGEMSPDGVTFELRAEEDAQALLELLRAELLASRCSDPRKAETCRPWIVHVEAVDGVR